MTNAERDKLIREIHTMVKLTEDKCKEHHKTLYGNGRPGLVSEHQATDSALRNHIQKHLLDEDPSLLVEKDGNKIAVFGNRVAVAAIIVSVIGMILSTTAAIFVAFVV